MIRLEALAMAIDCGGHGNADSTAEGKTAWARLGELWLGISDRLLEVEVEPVPELPPELKLAAARAASGDEEVVTAMCGHREPAMLIQGHWVHPATMFTCDDPPVKGPRRADG